MKKELFRNIPRADDLLEGILENPTWTFARSTTLNAIREVLDETREKISCDELTSLPSENEIKEAVQSKIELSLKNNLKPVINASGIIIHTNIGRSVLSEFAAKSIYDVARQYSNIEFNLKEGKRGSRYDHVEELLTILTGSEGGMVVNNNAAAVMLALSTMAKGREVIVSRGELVEIGGSFRIPEIIALSGCKLVEVGTTNKTHLYDYENAINENTALLLKIHRSNFSIVGFTEEASTGELAELAHKYDLPLVYDIGSGSLISGIKLGNEPSIQESLEQGADMITFSGDKLLGSTQAGVIVGKKEFVENCKKNQLTRALRVDKLTIVGLEATLRQYLNIEQAKKDIPTLAFLHVESDELYSKANKLYEMITSQTEECELEIISDKSKVGGGSLPELELETYCVAVTPKNISVGEVELKLRELEVPIIARISKNKLLFDVRTILDNQMELVAESIGKLI